MPRDDRISSVIVHGSRRRRVAAVLAVVALTLTGACAGGGEEGPDGGGAGSSSVPTKDITFETSDGVELAGRLFGEGEIGVALAHMYPADARSWYGGAEALAEAGYMTLAFNFRGYAPSEGDKSPSKAADDVRGATAALRREGAKHVALVGASMGGTASIVAAEDREALAVVAISAPARFMTIDAIIVAQNVQRPVLLMAARGDSEAFESLSELERALPNPDTKIFDSDAHGTALIDERPEAVEEIISFLQRYAPSDGVALTPEP